MLILSSWRGWMMGCWNEGIDKVRWVALNISGALGRKLERR
jgi:hypothetical protein